MTLAESNAPDQPFPGAHSQVPGSRRKPASAPQMVSSDGRRTLPLDATPVATGDGWSIRLQCRAEELTPGKRVVVYERVLLRKRGVAEIARVDATLRREELRVEAEGDLDLHEDR